MKKSAWNVKDYNEPVDALTLVPGKLHAGTEVQRELDPGLALLEGVHEGDVRYTVAVRVLPDCVGATNSVID